MDCSCDRGDKEYMTKALMIQGTASSVGKSILVTALCRILKQDGFSVAPFKALNISLNSFVTRGGGEIGRAQVVQAEAAGIEPTVDMNPILLKPEADARSQVILRGKVEKTISAEDCYLHTPHLLSIVEESLNTLCAAYDVVVIEGAGSPAEINLKEREIANMRVAKMARAPVLLVGDIDRGGVFAALIGTMTLLDEDERDYIKGFVINKFRGDVRLLKPGLTSLEMRTNRRVIGVIPYFRDISIAQEDSVYLDERLEPAVRTDLDVAVIHCPHISNYDDFDPLEMAGCRVRYVARLSELGIPDLIVLPGTKSTASDLLYLWQTGFVENIIHQARSGTPVIGICGGYQMLGKVIHDPDGVESAEGSVTGMGLLDIVTTYMPQKSTTQVRVRVVADRGLLKETRGHELTGYEIHMGHTLVDDDSIFHVVETPQGVADYHDGALNAEGTIFGTYLHGLFHNADFTRILLNNLRCYRGLPAISSEVIFEKEKEYDKLAELVRHNMDMDAVYRMIEPKLSGTDKSSQSFTV